MQKRYVLYVDAEWIGDNMYKLSLQLLIPNILIEMLRVDIHTKVVSLDQIHVYGSIVVHDLVKKGIEASLVFDDTVSFSKFTCGSSKYIRYIYYYSGSVYGIYCSLRNKDNAMDTEQAIKDIKLLYRNDLPEEVIKSFKCKEAIDYLRHIDNSDIYNMLFMSNKVCNECRVEVKGSPLGYCPVCKGILCNDY